MSKTFAVVFVASLVVLASPSRADLIFGSNVIVNGGAEADSNMTLPSGWTNSGATIETGMMVVSYANGGGFPLATDPGPIDRGANFFSGGTATASSSMTQLLNVSNQLAAIDSGKVSFNLSAYLGGYLTQTDHSVFTVTFETASDAAIGSTTLGPVTAAGRNNLTGLLPVSADGLIPVGTRNLLFTLTATRDDGGNDDGYADNLSFVADPVTAVPESSTWGMMILGFAGIGLVACRRKNNQNKMALNAA
jgi:hypothetical protein